MKKIIFGLISALMLTTANANPENLGTEIAAACYTLTTIQLTPAENQDWKRVTGGMFFRSPTEQSIFTKASDEGGSCKLLSLHETEIIRVRKVGSYIFFYY